MATIGQAFIEVHADTLPFDRELDRDLQRAAKDAEKGLDRTGTQFGDKIADSTSKRLGQRGKDFGRAVENATRNVVIRVRSTFRFDQMRNSIRRFFRRDVGESITEEVDRAINRAGRGGGPFSKLGQTIADAVGAGFNVSGRSPLIALLIPALAALVGLILGLIQAVNALVAVLFIIPGLLASIGLQAGVLVIAFQGMGEAIQGAFAAKNAKELNEALKNLTPAAQDFVRELLPLRDLFKEIGRTVQQNFFAQITGVITSLRQALGPSLVKGFGDTATALGKFFRAFGELLASPGFVNFFNKLIPATSRWLDSFGQSLFGRRGFITALINMATVLMPFMEQFGDIILRNLDHLSALIFQLGARTDTQAWLDNMAKTLQLVFDLLFKVGEFLFVFMAQLDKAGGQEIFKVLMDALAQLMFVLASPAGLKAMEGLVNFGIIGIKVFTGLIVAVLLLLAALEVFGEWWRVTAGPFILDIIRAIGQAAVDMATFLGVWIERIVTAIGGFFVWLWGIITTTKNNFSSLVSAAASRVQATISQITSLPNKILAAVKGFGSLLFNAGKSLLQGLINGIKNQVQPLLNLVNWISGQIGGFFGNSPAIYGALSGQGWTKFRGQNIMQGLIEGIESEIPALREATMNATSNIMFGRDSVQVNLQGPAPDQGQARTIGSSVGLAAADIIAARNTRLAVRTL